MSKIERGALDDIVTAGYQWSRVRPGERVLAPTMPLSLAAWYRAMRLPTRI